MVNNDSENKRLAKNSLILYLRMLFTTFVGLFSSRILLKNLGIDDYGIYNVVGGVIVLFSSIQVALANGTSRFITVAIGKGDIAIAREIYSTCFYLHVILGLVILILGETLGLWFFYNYLVIPQNSLDSAFWVYQFSILTAILSVLCVPDNSLIIAHEKMQAFAYISIYESILKLVIAYLLIVFSANKLFYYALFICILQVSIRICYTLYCKYHFEESKLVHSFDICRAKEITKFSSFVLIPGIGSVFCAQGLNILINIFSGPAVNAARGIAVQVQSVLLKFVQSFQQAMSPQITKNCAINEFNRMHDLVVKTSKFSFYIMAIPFIPLFFNIEYVLKLWLHEVPEYTSVFCRYTLIITLLSTLDYPFLVGTSAKGNIKKLYTIGGLLTCSVVPIAYVVLKCGADITSTYTVYLIVHILCIMIEIFLGSKVIGFKIRRALFDIILPVLISFFISCTISSLISNSIYVNSIYNLIFISIIEVVITSLIVVLLGTSKTERVFIKKIINKYIGKKHL